MDVSQESSSLEEDVSKMERGTTFINQLKWNRLKNRFTAYHCKNATLADVDALVSYNGGRFSVWPHPVTERALPEFADEDLEVGAEYCCQYKDQLARLEPIVEDFHQYLRGRYNPPITKQAREAFKIRCTEGLQEYSNLLVRICIDRASTELQTSLRLEHSRISLLQPADTLIKPWGTSTLCTDEGKPLLTVKVFKVNFDEPGVFLEEFDPALRIEMTCRMYQHSLLQYQALYIDGCYAYLRFIQVPDINWTFRNNKSRIAFASYTLPRDRDGFVCHLVQLLKNSDDYTKYFSHGLPYVPFPDHDPAEGLIPL